MTSAPTAETYVPRLKERYESEIRPQLQADLGFSTPMDVPRVTKVTLNMGVGDAKTDAKALDAAIDELTIIAGQRAQVRRATKSIASIALPRIRDFRGLDPESFDGRGNYSIGIREQIIFPEIDYDQVPAIRGLDVAITTSAKTDEGGRALLGALGLPFAASRREQGQ